MTEPVGFHLERLAMPQDVWVPVMTGLYGDPERAKDAAKALIEHAKQHGVAVVYRVVNERGAVYWVSDEENANHTAEHQ